MSLIAKFFAIIFSLSLLGGCAVEYKTPPPASAYADGASTWEEIFPNNGAVPYTPGRMTTYVDRELERRQRGIEICRQMSVSERREHFGVSSIWDCDDQETWGDGNHIRNRPDTVITKDTWGRGNNRYGRWNAEEHSIERVYRN